MKGFNEPIALTGDGNAPLLPPVAASPPEGEILAALCIEMLMGEMVPSGLLSHRTAGWQGN